MEAANFYGEFKDVELVRRSVPLLFPSSGMFSVELLDRSVFDINAYCSLLSKKDPFV